LLLIQGSFVDEQSSKFDWCLNECDQLVAIFHKTVMTLKQGK
jgi:hypothetical protein